MFWNELERKFNERNCFFCGRGLTHAISTRGRVRNLMKCLAWEYSSYLPIMELKRMKNLSIRRNKLYTNEIYLYRSKRKVYFYTMDSCYKRMCVRNNNETSLLILTLKKRQLYIVYIIRMQTFLKSGCWFGPSKMSTPLHFNTHTVSMVLATIVDTIVDMLCDNYVYGVHIIRRFLCWSRLLFFCMETIC